MPIVRMRPKTTALLVVDIQERLISTIHEHSAMVTRTQALIGIASLLNLPIVVTEQNVRGLGRSVSAIRDALPTGTPVFEKFSFSALTPVVRDHIRSLGNPDLLVCGIEAHVCVLQTVLDCCTDGIQTFHATDAISSGQQDQIEPAFRRMERAGSIPTGVLSAAYELMGSSEHPAFRAVLPLAKSVVSIQRLSAP